jgi:Putative zinc-finger
MTDRMQPLESACKEYEEDLVLHYYGENSADDRRRIEQHLQGCDRCRVFVGDLRRLLPQMAKSEEMPQTFWDSYYRETVAKLAEQEERKSWWRSWLVAPVHGWMVPAFGTLAGTVLVVGLLFGKGNLSSFIERPSRNIPQEIIADTNQLEFFRTMDMLEALDKLEQQDGTQGELQNTHSSRDTLNKGVA